MPQHTSSCRQSGHGPQESLTNSQPFSEAPDSILDVLLFARYPDPREHPAPPHFSPILLTPFRPEACHQNSLKKVQREGWKDSIISLDSPDVSPKASGHHRSLFRPTGLRHPTSPWSPCPGHPHLSFSSKLLPFLPSSDCVVTVKRGQRLKS